MRTKQIITTSAIAMMAPLAAFAVNTEWQADAGNGGSFVGNWTNSGNWSNGVPGVDVITDPAVKIDNSAAVVTINSDVSTGTAIQQFEMKEGTLNIGPGGVLDVGANNKDFRSGDANGSLVSMTGGTFTIRHQFQMARFGDSTIDVSNGTLDYVGDSGAGRVMRIGHTDASAGSSTLNVSGTGVVNNVGSAGTGTGARIGIDEGTSSINLSGSATFNSNSNYQMNFNTTVIDHTFKVTGGNVSATLGDVNAFAQNAASAAKFEFVGDGTGLSTITVADLDLLGDGVDDIIASLTVDLTGIVAGEYDLFDYTTLTGTAFSSVIFTNGSATINYGDGTADSISITVVPEPGTFALLAGIVGFAVVSLRRRAVK